MAVCVKAPTAERLFYKRKMADPNETGVKISDVYRWACVEQGKSRERERRQSSDVAHSPRSPGPRGSDTDRSTDSGRFFYPKCKSENGQSSYTSLVPTPAVGCIRCESKVNRDLDEVITPLSRQVCDVFGPSVCHFCGKTAKRYHSTERSESAYPGVHLSEDNFRKALLLGRYFPDKSTIEIQKKVSKGEISLNILKNQKPSTAPPDGDQANKRIRKPRNFSQNAVGPEGCTWTYFQGIQDLNHKLTSLRRMDQMARALPKEFGKYAMNSPGGKNSRLSVSHSPSFLKSQDLSVNKSKYGLYYEPPVMTLEESRDRQKHVFFAGKKVNYKLPDRLPDDIVPQSVINSLNEQYEQSRRSDSMTSLQTETLSSRKHSTKSLDGSVKE